MFAEFLVTWNLEVSSARVVKKHHDITDSDLQDLPKREPVPIASMGLVYLPRFTIKKTSTKCRNIYHIWMVWMVWGISELYTTRIARII